LCLIPPRESLGQKLQCVQLSCRFSWLLLYLFSFSFPFDEKKQTLAKRSHEHLLKTIKKVNKSCALRGAFFRTFLCTNPLISRTVLRRPFPFRTSRRFRKPDNAPSSYTSLQISELLRHKFSLKGLNECFAVFIQALRKAPPPNQGFCLFQCPPANRLNTKLVYIHLLLHRSPLDKSE